MRKMEGFTLSMQEWSKILPGKNISAGNPVKKTAAEMVSVFPNIAAEDMQEVIGLDKRMLLRVNIELKYRQILRQE